jgi:hypothetical protein
MRSPRRAQPFLALVVVLSCLLVLAFFGQQQLWEPSVDTTPTKVAITETQTPMEPVRLWEPLVGTSSVQIPIRQTQPPTTFSEPSSLRPKEEAYWLALLPASLPIHDNNYTLCTLVKDERPRALEWLAFHLEAGFTRFVIYDDVSSDGLGELLKSLNLPYLEYIPITWKTLHEARQTMNTLVRVSFLYCLAPGLMSPYHVVLFDIGRYFVVMGYGDIVLVYCIL